MSCRWQGGSRAAGVHQVGVVRGRFAAGSFPFRSKGRNVAHSRRSEGGRSRAVHGALPPVIDSRRRSGIDPLPSFTSSDRAVAVPQQRTLAACCSWVETSQLRPFTVEQRTATSPNSALRKRALAARRVCRQKTSRTPGRPGVRETVASEPLSLTCRTQSLCRPKRGRVARRNCR